MGFLWTIIIGAAIGALAVFSVAGDRSNYSVNAVLGSLGGLLASHLGQDFGWNGPNDGAGPVGSVIGPVLMIAMWRAIARRRAKPKPQVQGTSPTRNSNG